MTAPLAIPLRAGMSPLAERAAREGWLKWAIAISAAFAAVLEVIDVSIVNVALPYMQGNLGATLSEIGWVSTGYSIANVIVIPLSAWLGTRFGKKRYFIFSLVAFTLASVMCGVADNLGMLIVGRVIQGLGGGGLLAKAQALMFETFPREEQAKASMVFTLGVIAGPAIGPALGGYLTDNFGWRWIFFINVPLGIMAVFMCTTFPAAGRPEGDPAVDVDWLGILLPRHGAGRPADRARARPAGRLVFLRVHPAHGVDERLRALAAFRLAGTAYGTLPAVDLHVLRYRSLWAGSLLSLVVGMGLYGTIFVVPIFAQTVLKFTATKTGLMLVPGALASAAATFASRPLAKIFLARASSSPSAAAHDHRRDAGSLTTLNPDTGSGSAFLAADLARIRHRADVLPALARHARADPEEGRRVGLRVLQPHAPARRQHRHRGDHDARGQAAVRPSLATGLRRLPEPEPRLPAAARRQQFLPADVHRRPDHCPKPGARVARLER